MSERLLSRPGPLAAGLALLLAAAVLVAPWTGHVDDTDAQLYQVVARHMVQDGRWLDLRYLADVHPHFREHLPFGLWPFAVAIRVGGERTLPPLAGLFTMAALVLLGLIARRLGGWTMATLTVLVLATTESFIIYGGRERLDPLLLLLVVASLLPLLAFPPTARRWLLGALFAALAAMVKGPFGLLPFLAAGLAVAFEYRSVRWAAAAFALTLLAALPVATFLLADKAWGSGTWWTGYVEAQLFESATGERLDGLEPAWFPFATIAGRFWPGLPLLAMGVARSLAWPQVLDAREPPTPKVAQRLALTALLILLGLALPERKVWHHALVAYPVLALLAGAGATPVVRLLLSTEARRRAALLTLFAMAVLCGFFDAMGGGALWWKPCVPAAEFRADFDRLTPGEPVLVVSDPPHWRMVAILAAERQLEPWMEKSLVGGADHHARLAIVEKHLFPASPLPETWRKVGEARGWVLLRRE